MLSDLNESTLFENHTKESNRERDLKEIKIKSEQMKVMMVEQSKDLQKWEKGKIL
jgi:ATP-binding cassette, subfamily C (CFTR/MRP), member 1